MYSPIQVDVEDSSYSIIPSTIYLTVNGTLYTSSNNEMSLSRLANNTTPTFTSGGGTAGTCNITLLLPNDLEDEEWKAEFTSTTDYTVYRRALGSSDTWTTDGTGTNGTTYQSSNRGIIIDISGGSPAIGDKWEWNVYCGRRVWFFPSTYFEKNSVVTCTIEAQNSNGDSASSTWAFNIEQTHWTLGVQLAFTFHKSVNMNAQFYTIFKKVVSGAMQPYFVIRDWYATGDAQLELPVCEIFIWNIGGSSTVTDEQAFLVYGSGNVRGYWIEHSFGSALVRAYTIANMYGSGSVTHIYIKNWGGAANITDLFIKDIGGSAVVYGRTDTGLFIKLQIIPEELKQALEDVGITFN